MSPVLAGVLIIAGVVGIFLLIDRFTKIGNGSALVLPIAIFCSLGILAGLFLIVGGLS